MAGDQARYIGTRKNLFDLRRTAVVHNVLAKMFTNTTEESATNPNYWIGVLVVIAFQQRRCVIPFLYTLKLQSSIEQVSRDKHISPDEVRAL